MHHSNQNMSKSEPKKPLYYRNPYSEILLQSLRENEAHDSDVDEVNLQKGYKYLKIQQPDIRNASTNGNPSDSTSKEFNKNKACNASDFGILPSTEKTHKSKLRKDQGVVNVVNEQTRQAIIRKREGNNDSTNDPKITFHGHNEQNNGNRLSHKFGVKSSYSLGFGRDFCFGKSWHGCLRKFFFHTFLIDIFIFKKKLLITDNG